MFITGRWDSGLIRKMFRTSHLASNVIASLLLATVASGQGVPQTLAAPKQIRDFRTVSLINANADAGVFDKLSARVQEWGRWKIVEQREKADLLLVLSEKKEVVAFWMSDPMPIFELNPYWVHWPSAMTEIDTLTLVAVDRAADRPLLAVSCARHHIPSAPKWLVYRLRKKIEKRQKLGK